MQPYILLETGKTSSSDGVGVNVLSSKRTVPLSVGLMNVHTIYNKLISSPAINK
jgi:hypothetical protein